MAVYYIKDKTTGQPYFDHFSSLHKQDLKELRDKLNKEFPFCCDKKQQRFSIREMK